MASPAPDRFREQLDNLAQLHQDRHALGRARSALMWLSVAQRPLRALELWLALEAGECPARGEPLERLLLAVDDPARTTDDQRAAAALGELLRGLVLLVPGPRDPSQILVALRDAEGLPAFIYREGQPQAKQAAGAWRALVFTEAQAHAAAGHACVTMCAVSALHLAQVPGDRGGGAAGLLLYTWENWAAHLALSGLTLAHEGTADVVDAMVRGVCLDALIFLLSLNDLVTGAIPLSAGGFHHHTGAVAWVKRIQELAEQPVVALSAVLGRGGCTPALQAARDAFVSSKKAQASAGAARQGAKTAAGWAAVRKRRRRPVRRRLAVGSQVETLGLDSLWLTTATLFAPADRQVISIFADTARSLRSLAVALAQPFIYEELQRQHGAPWSPLGVLAEVASWMEMVASYPYWAELPTKSTPNKPFEITNSSDVYYDEAALVRERLLLPSDAAAKPEGLSRAMASRTSRPPEVSRLRWYAALLLDKASSIRTGPALVTNGRHSPGRNHDISSFECVPAELQGLNDPLLRGMVSLVPDTIRRSCAQTVSAFLGPIEHIDSTAHDGVTHSWPAVKGAILADGYRAAAAVFIAAVLLNHMRQTFYPRLGAYIWNDPLEDLRLARSNPEVFLDHVLSFSWAHFLAIHAQKHVWDLLGGLAVRLLRADGGRVPPAALGRLQASSPAAIPYWERAMELWRLGYLVWMLAAIEYILARTIHTYSFGVACWRLLSRGEVERRALRNVIEEHWSKLPVVLWQLFHHTRHGVLPLLGGSLAHAVRGRPALLLLILAVAGGVAAIIKKRSTFFIALQVFGLFIALGLLALGAMLLAVELVHDPLGLEANTARMRRKADRIRRDMPPAAVARAEILGARGALPVCRPSPSSDNMENKAGEEAPGQLSNTGLSSPAAGLRKRLG